MSFKLLLEKLKTRIDNNSNLETVLSEMRDEGIMSETTAWQLSQLIRHNKTIERAIYFVKNDYITSIDYQKLWEHIVSGKKVIAFINNTNCQELGFAYYINEHFVVGTNLIEHFHGQGFYYFNEFCVLTLLEYIEPS